MLYGRSILKCTPLPVGGRGGLPCIIMSHTPPGACAGGAKAQAPRSGLPVPRRCRPPRRPPPLLPQLPLQVYEEVLRVQAAAQSAGAGADADSDAAQQCDWLIMHLCIR